jgi:cytochrome c biogenesis protein CcdA
MDTTSLLTSISLITAFADGMTALFAPCCITYLLPTYLGSIFREKSRVVWATLVFGLGLASVLVPTALGIRAIGAIFQEYHTQTYVFGGAFMILLGIMELTGKKITLPMFNRTIDLNKRHDPWSIFLLGVFSGLTTSCCTPVLAGILTLSFLSPTFFWAALAGVSYVLGMLVPLVVIAFLLERFHWGNLSFLRGKTDAIAGIIFIIVGSTFIALALTGRIAMGEELPLEQTMGTGLMDAVRWVRMAPGSEILFAFFMIGIIILSMIKFIRRRP